VQSLACQAMRMSCPKTLEERKRKRQQEENSHTNQLVDR
jgi:hypothetical protein